MRLERASAYGLLALIYLAQHGGDSPAQVQQVASATGVPVEYLRKLMGRLCKARLIASVRGRHGGFRLAIPIGRITVLRVVEAIEGPIDSSAFLHDDLLAQCNGLSPQLQAWRRRTASQVRQLLADTTLGEMIDAS